MSNLIDFVLANVDSKTYYQKKFPEWDGNHNTNVKCPFHDDKKPSFSVNINGDGGCYCQACGKKIGSIIHFGKETPQENDVIKDDETAASRIYSEFIRPILAAPEEVDITLHQYETGLRGAPKVFVSLQNEIQISPKTIERFCLGWSSSKRRITIPLVDTYGQLLNIRYYRLPSMRNGEAFPKLLNEDGFGSPAALFPQTQLFSLCRSKHKPPVVFWMSGERDTLKAWDDAVPSFCYTTGEKTCQESWGEEIKQLKVPIGIVQDNDKAGREGAKKRLSLLEAAGIPAFIIELEGEGVKDYSDWRKEGGTPKEFLDYAKEEAKSANRPAEETSETSGTEANGETSSESNSEFYTFAKVFDPTKVSNLGDYKVSDIGHNPDLLNKPIITRAIVSGMLPRTYSIPYIFEVNGHNYKLPISREMVELIGSKDKDITRMVHVWLNSKAKVQFKERMTVTEVEIIPMIQPGVESRYVNQKCYFFGDNIECNKPYEMVVIPTSQMDSQETIGLILSVVPVSNILDSYKFDNESYKLLAEEFQVPKGETVLEGLRLLSHNLSEMWTGIRNRDDLHLAALLTWISPLQFEFPFEGLQRGWLNTLILGDTETGKSKVCQKLTALFHCGVFINAESCSYVGLVGGAIKSSSGMFLLRWGKIPLYNRQLVVMEELSGLTTQEISWMSDIRSSGVARYDKAGLTGETSAKTRLLCLSNVRGEGKSLGDFNTGVQAAQDLVGHNEDLARFDLMLTITDDEVDSKVINADRSTEEEKKFTEQEQKAFKELVMFAWSLKPEQIDFTLSAYKACLIQTMKLAAVYHSSLPVFKAGSGRLKLARIALAIACIQFSWDNTREKLVVTSSHVEGAAELLNRFYKKPSFGYARYSSIQYNLQKVTNEPEVLSKTKEIFKEKEHDFFLYVSHSNGFSKFEIAEAMGVHSMFVERIISVMFLSNLLKRGEQNNQWALSKAGRKWVEKQLLTKGVI